jgi:class 3 adenylate cyclase
MIASPRTFGRADLPTGLVTFLFTDIEGSTRLSQKLGDAFAMVIDRHHAIMREAFARLWRNRRFHRG